MRWKKKKKKQGQVDEQAAAKSCACMVWCV